MNILYRKQKRQKSLDNGVTWIDTGEYRVGDILENPSNCSSTDSKQCRWTELPETEGYYCDGYNKYTVQVEECSENGIIWTKTGYSRKGNTLIESNSTECGYTPSTGSTGDTGSTIECNVLGSGKLEYLYNRGITGDDDNEYIILNNEHYQINQNIDSSYTLSDFGIETLYSCASAFTYSPNIELVSFFDTSNVTNMSHMFQYAVFLYDCVDFSSLNVSNVTDMSYMFAEISLSSTMIFDNWNTSKVTNMNHMFYFTSIFDKNKYGLDLSSWDVSNVTDMSYMFADCSYLTSLDLSGWNTSNVTDMSYMFGTSLNTHGLYIETLDLRHFDVSKVTNMKQMFYNCTKLKTLNLSGWNTINITDMSYMFADCSSLTSLNVSGWNTSNVTDMSYMLQNCSSLISLDLSSFNTSNVTNMKQMFYGCSNLKELNLTGWDFKKAMQNISGNNNSMFGGCIFLKNVYLGEITQAELEWLQEQRHNSITFIYTLI